MPWSDWQEPFDIDSAVFPDSYQFNGRISGTSESPGDTASQVSSDQSTLKAGGGSPSLSGSFSASFEAYASNGSGTSITEVRHGYVAATYLGSVYAALAFPPTFPSSGYGAIPDDQVDANTVFGLAQFEAHNNDFVGWQDSTIDQLDCFTLAKDPGRVWTPPSTVDLAIGLSAPLAHGTLEGTSGGTPVYDGPSPLVYGDVEIVNTQPMTTISTVGADAPYTPGGDTVVTDTQDVTVTLSGWSEQDVSIVLLTTLEGPDTFTLPTLTDDNMAFAVSYGKRIAFSWFAGFSGIAFRPVVTYRSPRWRYWIPVNWHTVGGHWGDLGSVPLKILTPLPDGNTWVDVVDGPA